ncbi:MAG: SEC-C metal-binding domain-containing protein, partial [Desulfococcaceae bacterium]
IFSRFKPFSETHRQWAFRQLDYASSEAERSEMEERLFGNVDLVELLAVAPHSAKKEMFRLLSPERFAKAVPQLVDGWEDMEGPDQRRVGEILLEIGPEEAVKLFQAQAEDWDPAADEPYEWEGILAHFDRLPADAAESMAQSAFEKLDLEEGLAPDTVLAVLLKAALRWMPEKRDTVLSAFFSDWEWMEPECIPAGAEAAEALSIDPSALYWVINELDMLPDAEIRLPEELFPDEETRSLIARGIRLVREEDYLTAFREMQPRLSSLSEFHLSQPFFSDEADFADWANDYPHRAGGFLLFAMAGLMTRSIRLESGIPALSTERILELIAVDSLQVPYRDALMAELSTRPAAEAAAAWGRVMAGQEGTLFALDNLVKAAADLGAPELATPLCALLDHHPEFAGLSPLLTPAGREVGEPLFQALERRYPELSPEGRIGACSFLFAMPPAMIETFAEKHWEDLWKLNRALVLELAENALSEAGLERIRPKAGKGQSDIDRTFVLLAELLGREFPELDDARKTVFQADALQRRLDDALLDHDAEALLSIPSYRQFLECAACGAENEYDLNRVYLLEDPEQPFFPGQEYTCPDCGATGEMEWAESTERFLQGLLMYISLTEDEKERRKLLETSIFELNTLQVFGKTHSIPDGLEAYESAIRESPNKVGLRIGYANVLTQLGRPARATEFYKEALARDPSFIQAHFGLATLAAKAGDEAKAFDWLEEGRRHWDEAQVFTGFSNAQRGEMLEAFFENYCDFYNETAENLGLKVARLHPPRERIMDAETGKKKVGRNDLCPCGSGKKYKKCCLGRVKRSG